MVPGPKREDRVQRGRADSEDSEREHRPFYTDHRKDDFGDVQGTHASRKTEHHDVTIEGWDLSTWCEQTLSSPDCGNQAGTQ